MAIQHAIVHHIHKPEGGATVVEPRSTELPLTPALEELIGKVNATYNNRSGKIYGNFETDQEAFPCARWLAAHLDGETDFSEFSRRLLERLRERLDQQEEPLSGYLMLVRLTVLEVDQLLVLLLSTAPSVVIDEQLELSDAQHLDIGKLQLGVKINLDEWRRSGGQQYCSFVKGRSGKSASEAFIGALGCTEEADARKQTQTLLRVFNDYCGEQQLDAGKASQARQKAYEYCNEQAELGDRVRLKELSCIIDTEDPDKFFNYAGSQGDELMSEIPADRRGLQKFVRYSGSMKGLSLSFSEALLGEQVVYDPASDSITIRGLPPTLRKQLDRGKR
ncbi:nucleoid-associated protein [Motiliproteus sediminis]|uniref:nucleoid-associated protein n=1 Tax=Motiliproteus sediminis TaxID=1468178 RepID=UPI001AEF55D9|nr:nucleoid-associated protein [Motiliproteus sediminis]